MQRGRDQFWERRGGLGQGVGNNKMHIVGRKRGISLLVKRTREKT